MALTLLTGRVHRYRWLATLGSVLVAGAAALLVTRAAGAPFTFGGPADIAFARDLWQALVKLHLAGPDAYQTVPYPGQYPHGAVLELFDTRLEVRSRRAPVIVLRNYRGSNIDPATVSAHPHRYLDAIAVMFQRPGYDPADHDWFWAEFEPDGALMHNAIGLKLAGRIAKGSASTGCIACHRVAPGADLVFNHDRFKSLP